MEEKLIQRLESAVSRLEALSSGGFRGGGSPESGGGDAAPVDPSILAFDDLTGQYLARVSAAAEKIGGQVSDVTEILQEAFAVLRDLLVKVKQTQVRDFKRFAVYERNYESESLKLFDSPIGYLVVM